MSENGNGSGAGGRRPVEAAVAARRRAQLVSNLRALAREPPRASVAGPGPREGSGPESGGGEDGEEHCDLCGTRLAADHRHLLQLTERRILCTCEPCWAMRAGQEDLRPTGTRTLWLDDLDLPDEVWAAFRIPIGLAFFMISTVTECVVAMYPSPAGATESELRFESWHALVQRNPILAELEPDIEGLIVNRMVEPPINLIAPIDRCYELTGTVKAHWEGISGGTRIEAAIESYFERLRGEAVPG